MLKNRILPLAVAAFIAAALSTPNETQAIVINAGESAKALVDLRHADAIGTSPYWFDNYQFDIRFNAPTPFVVMHKLYAEFQKADGTAIGGIIFNGQWYNAPQIGVHASFHFIEPIKLEDLVGYLVVTSMYGTYDLDWASGYFQGQPNNSTSRTRIYTPFEATEFTPRNLELHRFNASRVPDTSSSIFLLAGALSLLVGVRHRYKKS